MDPAQQPAFPDRMNSYLTTEHFTLQGARSIVNAEISSRVTIYFTVLSSVIIASAFVAQISERNQIFLLFESLAFPLIILLGFFTAGRLAVLATILLHSAAAYLLGRPQFMKEEYLETRFPRPESKSEVDGDGEAAPES